MYNEELKQQYLKEESIFYQESTLYKIKMSFERVEFYEMQLNKDMYEMNADELINMFISAKMVKQASIQTYLSAFKNYLDWCRNKGLIKTNLLSREVRTNVVCDRISEMSNEKTRYFTKKQFQQYICQMRKSFNHDVAEYTIGVVMAIYEGIKGEHCDDLIYLRLSDIDEKENTCKLHSGKVIKVSDELITQLKVVSKISELKFELSNNERTSYLRGQLYDDSVFRFYKKETDIELDTMLVKAERHIRTAFNRFRACVDKEFKITDVYECGLAHYVHDCFINAKHGDLLVAFNDKKGVAIINRYLFDKTDSMRANILKRKLKGVLANCIK